MFEKCSFKQRITMTDIFSVICGLTEETSKQHIVKAAMEAVCFQTRDILEAMNQDCGIPLQKLLVDGGMTINNYLMQLQADLCGIPVGKQTSLTFVFNLTAQRSFFVKFLVRPTMTETTALGAAMMAGMAKGINVWDLDNTPKVVCDHFDPTITEDGKLLSDDPIREDFQFI